MHFQLYFTLLFISVVKIDGNIERPVVQNLRRYKVCNGRSCKAIRSFTPKSFLQDVDSFLYSRWTRWSKCDRDCTTSRHRSCRFPLICGNTVIHEEAICYFRGQHCEAIYENRKREYLNSEKLDYLDLSDYESHSHEEDNRMPQHMLLSDSGEEQENDLWSRVLKTTTSKPFHDTDGMNPRYGYEHNFDRQNETTRALPYAFPSPNSMDTKNDNDGEDDYDHLGAPPTCGVARITNRNRNGIARRILGGQETRQGRWPWQVAILNKMNEVFCGGTLISDRWILTAAHCIRKKLRVTIGEHHLHRHDGTERHYKIEAAFIHPDFDEETVDNDIALLLLPESVPVDSGLACIPEEHQSLPPPATLCTILGWGKERHTHVFGTTVLHEGQVPLVSNGECRFTYGRHEITNNMFCAGYRSGTVDSCAGDSGGPILCSMNNRWTVFGVTSFGDGCGRKGKYGIYAKVPNYVSWIRRVMKANDLY